MCTTCGCSDNAKTTITSFDGNDTGTEHKHSHETSNHSHVHVHAHSHDHHIDHEHSHTHSHSHAGHHAHTHTDSHSNSISLEQDILAKNNLLAARNRGWFEGRNILALNLVSSPGAGKTTLLERTLTDLKDQMVINVIEGDQETIHDAARIKETGCGVVQINTGTGCHLEADMLARGLERLKPPMNSVVMIENVGNLVCPALFDLGERCKVAILSVTEGEDKPLKYPHMFRAASLMILNKVDLLPYVKFDVDRCIEYARTVNPDIEILTLSAINGEGLQAWYQWLSKQLKPETYQETTAE